MLTPSHAQQLLGIIQACAPTGDAQALVAENMNRQIADGGDVKDVVKTLAGTLHDGLEHGNWPWTPPTIGTHLVTDGLPHSRACGITMHPHGIACHSNCPTCHGKRITA